MARKFYTCIVVPDSSERLHKLRVPAQALYLLAAIAVVSFFVAAGLGFNYLGMVSKISDYSRLEAENAQLRIDTRQLKLDTSKLDVKISALEDQTHKITQAIETEPLFRRFGSLLGNAGGSKENYSTAELIGDSLKGNVESMRTRMEELESQLSLLDRKTELIRSTPTIWPLYGRIGSHYGSRLDPFTGDAEMHLGLDIVGPMGSAIKAPADGIVIYSQRKSDYGNLIILDHSHGLTTRYGHLSQFKVHVGQTVRKGEIIGYVGLTGRTTAPHLHYEVRLNDRPEDPRKYLR